MAQKFLDLEMEFDRYLDWVIAHISRASDRHSNPDVVRLA